MKNAFAYVGKYVELILSIDKAPWVRVAYIDRSDLSKVADFTNSTWQARWSPSANTYYVQARGPDGRYQQLHRLIMNLGKKDKRVVDHEDHNGLNNRRNNLEVVSRAKNGMRRAGAQINSLTGYRGVTFCPDRTRSYRAATYRNKSTQVIGYFSSAQKAAKAVKKELDRLERL